MEVFKDDLFEAAAKRVFDTGHVSVSDLQRVLIVGYSRAYRIVQYMEGIGMVSSPDNRGKRTILKSA